MVKNIELLYTGKFNPAFQVVFFIVVNLLAIGCTYLLKLDPATIWVVFQTILFFHSTSSIVLGIFTNNDPKLYYPVIILIFIIFFTLSKRIPTAVSRTSIDDLPHIQNFVLLNVLFFFVFLLASLLYRGMKQALEKM